MISRVVVMDDKKVEHPGYEFPGFPQSRFKPTELPGRSAMQVIIHASAGHGFDSASHLVRIDWGVATKEFRLTEVDVGLWGLDPVLPTT